jgi:peptidoglycan/xylan/chitin deacetylase (PgdA/CDA1 family)
MNTTTPSEAMAETNAKMRLVLSFEAGGDPAVAGQMLDVLRREQVRASIFLLGNWAEAHPELVRRMAADGHQFGNHSYSHPDLTRLEADQIREELAATDALVKKICGQSAIPWLRPPYGAVNERLRHVAAEAGYRLILRDALDGGHWPGETTPDSILQRTLDNAYHGAVLTYHINNPMTVQVLADIIQQLRALGTDFVDFSDLPAVTEYAERHSDFSEIHLEPGYLQVMLANTRAWSMDVLEYGTRKTTPTRQPVRIAGTDRYTVNLVSGTMDENPLTLTASAGDRHLLIIHGAAEYLFRGPDDAADRLRVVARPGYLALWPKTYELCIEAVSQYWLLLILE